ncbi:FYN-binding protein 1 [Salmo salar]|uniref:FYN-binding protein 1 n=1 Tax=Salmo salar TaxID=8030 RepID=A0A1S3NPW1_SALSA|nr:FYN-binding protein 1-like [Salmo salar]|eukprot:XP_014017280.1 PREDICTED: FYN-binding protein-like isoform X2 [Salmo salar]
MARFNTGEGSPVEGGVHPKLASHSSLSTSSPLLAKLAALEKSRSGEALTITNSPATKPVFQKKFETAAREDVGTLFPKPQSFKPRPFETIRDTKSSGPESSFTIPPLKRPPVNTAFLDNKVKPALASGSAKPPWVKDSESENTATVPKLPLALKPKISMSSLQSNLDQETLKEHPTPSTPKLRPISMFKFVPPHTQQNSLSRQESEASLQTLNSSKCMPPQPPLTLKPNFLTAQAAAKDGLVPHEENDDPSAPKKKPLPNVFSLGDPPLKPNRPPHVTLQRFRTEGPELSAAGPPPCPLAPHTSSFPAPLTPCLLSNSPAAIIQADQEESYDDIGVMNLPSPLPPGGHPNLKIEAELSEEEMYEDLEERWIEQEAKGSKETNEVKGQEKKSDKEEKKRLEQEKKMQKAKEKKEQEAKKKYKLSGPIQVIHKAKAQVECKGGKTDLPLAQGETIDIIRITDNPEGRWLARNNEGNYGYVRTESVGIDYDLIKEQKKGPLPNQSERKPEIYDDVGILDNACSGVKVQQAEDGDIYDDVDGSNQNRFPPPLPTVFKEGDEIYDDVESQSFTAPPPPLNSPPQLTPKGKQEVMDPKKKKKFEKEEKEFRKKFRFEGEIQVLYDVTIDPTLDSKKWGNKDLQLKPGEVIDVIVKPTNGKLIGRNRDGKFGYVSMVNVAQDGGDVYDDIGENCIYDND